MAPSAVVALLLAVLAISHCCSGSPTSPHEIVKSPVYPNLPAGIRAFRDNPIHDPAVHAQIWYSNSTLKAKLRVFGVQLTFLDGYRSPIHGYARENSTSVRAYVYIHQLTSGYFRSEERQSLPPDGPSVPKSSWTGRRHGGVLLGFVAEGVLRPNPGVLEVTLSNPSFTRELSAVGYAPPGVILGLTGTVDHTGLTQLGYIIQARSLSFHESASGSSKGSLSWPQEAVVRVKPIRRLPDELHSFDDGATGEHGELVKVQLWTSLTVEVVGIQPTFEDGYTSPVRGFATGTSVTVTFDPVSNPLIAVGGRGSAPDLTGVCQLAALAFFAGGSSPPTLSPVYGKPHYAVYSDSPDGKIVGFLGTTSKSNLVQLGVHFVSPANGLLGTSGPFPRVSPSTTVPFDHTGENIGVSKIDVYHDTLIGLRGLRFTYVTHSGFQFTTPVYGQKEGAHTQIQFDYVNNPLVNIGVYPSNVLAGTGEVGLVGIYFVTKKDKVIGVFGVYEVEYFNVTRGTNRIVGFHGEANTVVNSLGVYTAPL